MACNDCYNNCGGKITSDKCVKYTGPDIDFLGISSGDSLSMLEAALIEKLENSINGTSITFEDFSTCQAITDALDGEDENLATIIQAMSDVICDLKTDVSTIQSEVDPPLSISAPCLTLNPNPTRDQVLQAIATKLCAINTTVTSISTNYVTTATLCTLVQDCVDNATSSTQEYSKMPKFVALPYHGPLSVFDSQGRGLSSAGYDKVYICNGQTVGTYTTPDYRGRSPLGVNQSVPGGALDTNVDPALAANAGYGIVQGTKKGAFTHILTINETAPHQHEVIDTGHTHSEIGPGNVGSHPGGSAGFDRPNGTQTNLTSSSVTGISLQTTGGGSPHNTTHPIIGTVFIIHIP